MTSMRFVRSLQYAFDFLSDILNGFMDVFDMHPWLFAWVVAPVIISVIIFGVSISYSLISKKSGGGER